MLSLVHSDTLVSSFMFLFNTEQAQPDLTQPFARVFSFMFCFLTCIWKRTVPDASHLGSLARLEVYLDASLAWPRSKVGLGEHPPVLACYLDCTSECPKCCLVFCLFSFHADSWTSTHHSLLLKDLASDVQIALFMSTGVSQVWTSLCQSALGLMRTAAAS